MTGAAQRKNKRITALAFAVPKWLISAFIVWQIISVAFWLLPTSTLQQGLVIVLRPYIWATACWQNWQMFAPNPASQDVYMEANIFYSDGTSHIWVFPRMIRQSFLQRYEDERFRKMIENAHMDSNRAIWPYVARFAAIANNKQPKTDPVVQVQLIRLWQDIPVNGMAPAPYHSYLFYTGSFPPGSLPGKGGAE